MPLNLLYRRLTQEDLQDAPKGSWKEKILYSLNLFMQQVYSLLQNQLTPEVNCIAQTKTFQLTGNSTASKNVYTFVASYPYYPLGYDLLNVQPTDGSNPVFSAAPFVSWNFLNGNINILGISGLTDNIPYTFTVRFWWSQVVNQ
jgi:hypothetical protein